MLRKTLSASLALFIAIAVGTCQAHASAWPGNWLGSPDNAYVSLRIGVHFYGCVLHDLAGEDGVSVLPRDSAAAMADLKALPEAELAWQEAEFNRVKAELEECNRFYWLNTRFNCAFDYDWKPDYTPCLRSSIASADAPYFSPVDHKAYGEERKQYDGLLQICVLYQYNKESGRLERVRGGGGFTWGCNDAKRECGWSWWAAPPPDHSCGSDWLMCHEFGHELDSLFHESGHPEHWFNHLSMLEANTATFGEHFDCMAYILRRTKETDWLDLRWGTKRGFKDADGDYAPDADDWLVAHHLIVDDNPAAFDADNDGLSDYAELLWGNGNRYGHGERLHPALRYCQPLVPDTDSDGILDGSDEFPYVPLLGNIHQAEATAPWLEPVTRPEDESISPTGTAPATLSLAGSGEAPALHTELLYQQDQSLHLRILWGAQGDTGDCELRVTFDFDNDGWFAGNDNYRFLLDKTGILKATQNICYSHTDWPTENSEKLDISLFHCTAVTDPGSYQAGLDLTLPHSLLPELAAKPGEEFGFNLGVRRKPAEPKAGNAWFYMIYDPNALMQLELR